MARICKNCGERLFPTDTFCGFCGATVTEVIKGTDENLYVPKPLVGEGAISQSERKQLEKARRVLASNPDVEAVKKLSAEKTIPEPELKEKLPEPDKEETEPKPDGAVTLQEAEKPVPAQETVPVQEPEKPVPAQETEETVTEPETTAPEPELEETVPESNKEEKAPEPDDIIPVQEAEETAPEPEETASEPEEADSVITLPKQVSPEAPKDDETLLAVKKEEVSFKEEENVVPGKAYDPDRETKKRIRDLVLLSAGVIVLLILLFILIKDDVKNLDGNDAYHSTNKNTASVSTTPAAVNKASESSKSSAAEEYVPTDRGGSWDGSTARKFAGGNGSDASPYLITCGSELAFLSEEVNRGVDFKGVTFRLDNDIDLAGNDWTPIGYFCRKNDSETVVYSFKGNFDGNGHSIKNLFITSQAEAIKLPSYSENVTIGLFGAVSNAKIYNLSIENCSITPGRKFTGEVRAGAIAGDVVSSEISKCSVKGKLKVTARSRNAAGLVAGVVSESKLSECSVSGSVELVNESGVNDASLLAGYVLNTKVVGGAIDGSISSKTAGNSYSGGVAGYSSGMEVSGMTVKAELISEGNAAEVYSMSGGISGAFYKGNDKNNKIESVLTATASGHIYAGGSFGLVSGSKTEQSETVTELNAESADGIKPLCIGGLAGYATDSGFNGTKVSGSVKVSGQNEIRTGGLFGEEKKNSISGFTVETAVNASASRAKTAQVIAGGITGKSFESEYSSSNASGKIEISSAFNALLGGAFGYIEKIKCSNIKAGGELFNKGKVGVSTGGFAAYAVGTNTINDCTGSANRKNESTKGHNEELIAIKKEG